MRTFVAILLVAPLLALPVGDARGQDADYVWDRPLWTNIDPAAAGLRARLERETLALVAHGHPKPAYFRVGMVGGFFLYGYGGETLYTLADGLDLLTPEAAALVLDYLAEEKNLAGHRPFLDGLDHGDEGWGQFQLDGLRRELHRIPQSYQVNVWPPAEVPPEALYMMARYAAVTEDWELVAEHWTEALALYDGIGSVQRYGEIAALIGMARLSHEMGETALRDEAEGRAIDALEASDWDVYASSAATRGGVGGQDWSYPIFHYHRAVDHQTGALVAAEVARFLHDERLTNVRTAVVPLIGDAPADHHEGSLPGWFLFRADYPSERYGSWGPQLFQGGENAYHTPDLAYTFFMIRAHVFEDGPALGDLVGFPACVGDLYYLQRLAAAVRAHGTRTWVDWRTAGGTPPVATISAPNDGVTIDSGDELTLEGSGTDPEDGELSGPSLVWTSNVQGFVATSRNATTRTLRPGIHVLTLQATDGEGLSGWDTVTVNVRDSGADLPPAPPRGLTATVDGLSVVLAWEANGEFDLAGYRVYRSEISGYGFEPLHEQLVDTPSYRDESPPTGVTLYYVVTAEDEAGTESTRSPEVSAMIGAAVDAGFVIGGDAGADVGGGGGGGGGGCGCRSAATPFRGNLEALAVLMLALLSWLGLRRSSACRPHG